MNRNTFTLTKKQFLLISLITSALPFLYWIYRGQGFYLMGFDFNDQIIPFGVDMVRTMREGGFDPYSFKVDLGNSALLSYAYYGWFSPFFLPALLFPPRMFPYIAGFLYILKYTVSCYTAYMYLRTLSRRETSAMIAGICYAFSGFSASSIEFYFFQDVVALFPLLLLTLENLIQPDANTRKAGILFSLAVFINCITNYFFFVQEVLFLIIYFLFRCAGRNYKKMLTLMGKCLLYGVLGTGMAAFVFLPNIAFSMGNSRVTDHTATAATFLHGFLDNLLVIKGFLLPGEMLNQLSSIKPEEFYISSVFLPGGMLSLSMAYIWKRRDRLSAMIIALMMICFSPFLSSFFLLFITPYYRWWFMLGLMICLAAARVLDAPAGYPLRCSAMLNIVLISFFTATLLLYRTIDGVSIVYYRNRLLLYTVIALAGPVILLLRNYKLTLISAMAVAVFTTHWVQYCYRRADIVTSPGLYVDRYQIACSLHTDDMSRRFRNHGNIYIIPADTGITGTSTYTSTAAPSLAELDALFGYVDPNAHFRMNKSLIPGLLPALGAGYEAVSVAIDPEYRTEEIQTGALMETYQAGGHEVSIRSFPASPIAYTTTRYITKEALEQLPVSYRGIALLYAVVIDSDDVTRLSESLQAVKPAEIMNLIEQDNTHMEGKALFLNKAIAELAEENSKHGLQDFSRGYHGMSGICHTAEETILYCSVPRDNGWRLTIDGEPHEVISSAGMMAVIIPAGAHEIRFHYRTPWLMEGLVITGLSFLGLLYLALSSGKCYDGKMKTNDTHRQEPHE